MQPRGTVSPVLSVFVHIDALSAGPDVWSIKSKCFESFPCDVICQDVFGSRNNRFLRLKRGI